MALNYSHRPIFPAHLAEDNLISPMRIVNGYLVEGVPEKTGEGFARPRHEGFARPRHGSREIDECVDYGRDIVESCCSPDPASKDIVDLLPSDPFGMDISTTFTAITGWLEDLEADYGGCGTRNNVRAGNEDYGLFAGFNLIWNNAMRFQSFPGNIHAGRKLNMTEQVNLYPVERDSGSALAHYGFGVPTNQGNMSSNSESSKNLGTEGNFGVAECNGDGDGAPHEALMFALGYLGVKDLLSVEMVCRSLRYTVQSDPLLWRRIHIEKPLNERITDDILLRLSSRAQGNLQCLSLLECTRVTDDGLRHVLECNPRLNKLCVPGCTRISIEGILSILRAFNKGSQCIRYLRIGGLYGVTNEHFEELKLLLNTKEQPKKEAHKPHFYIQGNIYLLCDDDRAIDVEVCPRCQKLRLVYDCPVEGCQVKGHTYDSCRACALCIARCIQCGKCINDNEYEETFCLELLCADCLTSPAWPEIGWESGREQGEEEEKGKDFNLDLQIPTMLRAPCLFRRN